VSELCSCLEYKYRANTERAEVIHVLVLVIYFGHRYYFKGFPQLPAITSYNLRFIRVRGTIIMLLCAINFKLT